MKYALVSIVAGLMAGISAVVLKMILTNFNMLYFLIFLITGAASLLLFQISLKRGKSGTVSSLFVGFSAVVAVAGGPLIGEALTAAQLFGAVLVILGSIAIVYDS